MRKLIQLLQFGLLVAVPLAAGAADLESAVLANPCAACHGAKGASPDSIPAIDQMPADAIAQALKDFKSGARGGTIMNRIAAGYSDEELDRIAKYFGDN
jgi:cytochrome c553